MKLPKYPLSGKLPKCPWIFLFSTATWQHPAHSFFFTDCTGFPFSPASFAGRPIFFPCVRLLEGSTRVLLHFLSLLCDFGSASARFSSVLLNLRSCLRDSVSTLRDPSSVHPISAFDFGKLSSSRVPGSIQKGNRPSSGENQPCLF